MQRTGSTQAPMQLTGSARVPLQRLQAALDRLSDLAGSAIAWLTVLMVVGTFVIVVLRYVFDLGWIAMQESIVWMHAAVFMLGAGYTLRRDEHVRVDIFYRRMTAARQAWVNVAGAVVFLLPLAGFIAVSSWDYAYVSWAIGEASREAGGLPYPFVPILKSLIPATAVLLILQGLADLAGATLVLTQAAEPSTGPPPGPPAGPPSEPPAKPLLDVPAGPSGGAPGIPNDNHAFCAKLDVPAGPPGDAPAGSPAAPTRSANEAT